MSITYNEESTKYTSVVQIETGERYPNGNKIYRKKQRSFDTLGDAEDWEKSIRGEARRLGGESLLLQSELTEYREAKIKCRDTDLREVAEFWAKHHPIGESLTCREVWEKYEMSREWNDYKPRTRSNKSHCISKFLEEFGDTLINEMTLNQFEDYLDHFKSDLTRNTNSSSIKTMFKWASHRRQGYLTLNQLKFVESVQVHFEEPKIISTDDVEKLFKKCSEIMPNMIPYLALQYFAGIRTSEIVGDKGIDNSRLLPRDFDFESKTIYIRSEVAKTKGKGKEAESARLLENLPDTLWKWLKAVDFKGEVDIMGHKERMIKLYREAGVNHPKSVGRHCFCSYAYGFFQDAGKVRKWTGHSNNDTIFKRHYAALVRQSEGKTYFDITPTKKITPSPKRNYRGATKELGDEELLQLSKIMSESQIAKAFGVTVQAIRKRLKKLS